ncbi:hypothetical protein [Streptomyces sp. NPDC002276]
METVSLGLPAPLHRFADEWTGLPLRPEDGCTTAELDAVEAELGFGSASPAARPPGRRRLRLRRYGAPGRLLHRDGAFDHCWVHARGRTAADLETIRADLPGPRVVG